VIGALAALNVADKLVDGARSADELAVELSAHPQALYRVLRAVASIGIFAEDEHGRFALTPTAACLRSDVAGSLRDAAIMFSLEPFWNPYSDLLHSVMTGEPAFNRRYGMSIYDYLERHPADARTFRAAAATFHAQGIEAIIGAYDFSRHRTVIDLGGGTGALLAGILATYPSVQGVLFERPSALAAAAATFERDGVTDRVAFVAGDFFASVPGGADAYLIKSCLHNFDDERAGAVLRAIRRAIPDRAPLLVAETVIPDGNGAHYSKFDDVEMLAIAGGADRTGREWAALLEIAGFGLQQVVPCGDRFSLLEAYPIEVL
jgi:SAM-dependent methyltransferase